MSEFIGTKHIKKWKCETIVQSPISAAIKQHVKTTPPLNPVGFLAFFSKVIINILGKFNLKYVNVILVMTYFSFHFVLCYEENLYETNPRRCQIYTHALIQAGK